MNCHDDPKWQLHHFLSDQNSSFVTMVASVYMFVGQGEGKVAIAQQVALGATSSDGFVVLSVVTVS